MAYFSWFTLLDCLFVIWFWVVAFAYYFWGGLLDSGVLLLFVGTGCFVLALWLTWVWLACILLQGVGYFVILILSLGLGVLRIFCVLLLILSLCGFECFGLL